VKRSNEKFTDAQFYRAIEKAPSQAAAARRLGVTKQAITERKRRIERGYSRRYLKWESDREDIGVLAAEGRTVKEIAALVGKSRSVVWLICKKAGFQPKKDTAGRPRKNLQRVP
jgi:transposase